MNRPLRYIHVGVGGFGQHWCTAVLPRLHQLGLARCVAAVDIDTQALARAPEQLGVDASRLYTSTDRALRENDADFVTVVVPPAHHERVVDLAISRGCHVLSEKPIADTLAASCRILRKVEGSGLKMAVTMSHRFDQDKQTLQSIVASGQFGRLSYVVHRYTQNARAFGSVGKFRHEMADPLFIEASVHHFDILRALCGSNAATVFARAWNPPWGEYAGHSTALVTVEMENGIRCFHEGAMANASTLTGWTNDYIRAECEHGTLELDHRRLRVLQGGPWEEPLARDLPLLQQDAWANAWLAELFCTWLLGGEAPPNTIQDNIQCAALVFAAVESAHAGAVVHVQDLLRAQMSQGA